MSKTTNYNLNKPEQTDFYDVDIFNENADIVDTALKGVSDTAEAATEAIEALADVASSGDYEDLTNKPNTGKGATVYTITADMVGTLDYVQICDCEGRIVYVCPLTANDASNASSCSCILYSASGAQGAVGFNVYSADDMPTDGIRVVVVDLGEFTPILTSDITMKAIVIDGMSWYIS